MQNLKHVGRLAKTKRRVVVAFKVVPGEPDNCLVVTTENLSADEHDSLMTLVESSVGQDADDLALVMARTPLPDGRMMLPSFHRTGKIIKVPTVEVEMVPNRNSSILLSELNEIIAQQRGISVEDLAVKGEGTAPVQEAKKSTVADNPVVDTASSDTGIISDEDLARQYRSQADALYKEAKRLRDEAEKLSPTKKTIKKKQVSEQE